MEDIKNSKYDIEIVYHKYIPINFDKLKNVSVINNLKFRNNKLRILAKYGLSNGHFYRGINYANNLKNIFSKDASFMKNALFDNSYDIVIEFALTELKYEEIGSHHVNSYRGNMSLNNIVIHKIFYNIFSEYDLNPILKQLIENIKIKKDNPEICGFVYDVVDDKNLYICNNFFID